jgi:hypothetical protein
MKSLRISFWVSSPLELASFMLGHQALHNPHHLPWLGTVLICKLYFSVHCMLIHVLKVGWYPPWQWFRNIGATHVPHNSEKKKCDLVWTQFIVMLPIAYFFRYWMKPTNYLMWNLRKPSMKSLMRFLKTGELSFFLQLWPKRFVNIEVYTRDETINSLDIWIDDKVMGFYVFYYVWFIYFVFHVNLTFLA